MKKNFSYFILPFALLFILSLLIINWSDISWVFDWQVIQRIGEEVIVSEKPEKGEEASGRANQLVVSALDLEVPLRTPVESDQDTLMAELDRGVVLYPNSARPGKRAER